MPKPELDVLKRAVIMNEIINSILEAEQKASEIVAKAGEESKLIAIKGEENAEKERGKRRFRVFGRT